MCRRRIAAQLPVKNLFAIEALVILSGGIGHGIMLRLIGLDHRLARQRSPSGSPHRLRQKLEGSLPGAVIVCAERKIRRQHPDKRHARKIMSLDNHLRADEHIRLPVGEGGENLLIAVLRLCGISVHSERAHIRKELPQLLLYLLGTCLKAADIAGAAVRTSGRLRFTVTAIMTDKPAALML